MSELETIAKQVWDDYRCNAEFVSYYKYAFTFDIKGNGLRLRVTIGGDSDSIYLWKVKRYMSLADVLWAEVSHWTIEEAQE